MMDNDVVIEVLKKKEDLDEVRRRIQEPPSRIGLITYQGSNVIEVRFNTMEFDKQRLEVKKSDLVKL
jgi:hypothetical protein